MLLPPEQVAEKINAGQKLILAGDEALLKKLPSGDWIGGTIPYYMARSGGGKSSNLIHVTELPKCAVGARTQVYPPHKVHDIYAEGALDFRNGSGSTRAFDAEGLCGKWNASR
jgi:hypothetical protein